MFVSLDFSAVVWRFERQRLQSVQCLTFSWFLVLIQQQAHSQTDTYSNCILWYLRVWYVSLRSALWPKCICHHRGDSKRQHGSSSQSKHRHQRSTTHSAFKLTFCQLQRRWWRGPLMFCECAGVERLQLSGWKLMKMTESELIRHRWTTGKI